VAAAWQHDDRPRRLAYPDRPPRRTIRNIHQLAAFLRSYRPVAHESITPVRHHSQSEPTRNQTTTGILPRVLYRHPTTTITACAPVTATVWSELAPNFHLALLAGSCPTLAHSRSPFVPAPRVLIYSISLSISEAGTCPFLFACYILYPVSRPTLFFCVRGGTNESTSASTLSSISPPKRRTERNIPSHKKNQK
jgi:hypothetical protein